MNRAAPTTPPNPAPNPPEKTASSRRPGKSSPLLLLLAPLAAFYSAGARVRARSWRDRRRRLPHPVLSVGNLTLGGTGKTPFVLHACRELRARGRRPGILSRGYRGGPEGNDEARMLAGHLPDVPHVQNPDRLAGGISIRDRVDCYVLDDGFQHHPLHRDVDVVLVDATDPFGGGWCPPAGRLREPLGALARADLVVLTRADLASREELGDAMRRVRSRTPAPVATAAFEPSCDRDLDGEEVLLACAIGNPAPFRRAVASLGARVVQERIFRDHHRYTARDVERLARPGLPVVVTEKDAVKLRRRWPAGPALHVVGAEFRALDGADAIAAVFDRIARES
ncbi:MAG: tetraacyldisaccharide 4'-kinase [Planctomycetota bacterium]